MCSLETNPQTEYVALCSEVCEMKYLRSLMRAENESSSAGRSKHIDVRYKFVAQGVTEGSVRVRYTSTQ